MSKTTVYEWHMRQNHLVLYAYSNRNAEEFVVSNSVEEILRELLMDIWGASGLVKRLRRRTKPGALSVRTMGLDPKRKLRFCMARNKASHPPVFRFSDLDRGKVSRPGRS